jgi:hypothetical protein
VIATVPTMTATSLRVEGDFFFIAPVTTLQCLGSNGARFAGHSAFECLERLRVPGEHPDLYGGRDRLRCGQPGVGGILARAGCTLGTHLSEPSAPVRTCINVLLRWATQPTYESSTYAAEIRDCRGEGLRFIMSGSSPYLLWSGA